MSAKPQLGVKVERMVRFPAPLYHQLAEQAKRERRSINSQLMLAIEEHLATERKV